MAKKKIVESETVDEVIPSTLSNDNVEDVPNETITEYETEIGQKRATKVKTLNGVEIERNDYAL